MVMDTAPRTKVEAIRRLGATLVTATYDECWRRSKHMARRACAADSFTPSTTTGSSSATRRWDSRFSKTFPTSMRSSARSAAVAC